jgi:hypothetical protein
MQGLLGEKIGEGVWADVHAWAPGQVIKLFKAGVPREIPWYEARMTRAVFAAGGPAPEVFGEVTHEGRSGIVLPRFDGPTLLQHYRSGDITFEQAGTILATCYMAIHKTPPPLDVLPLRDWMDNTLRRSDSMIPNHIATGIMALIEHLAPEDGLCHADLHPDNVIMTAEGPRVIDWLGAVRAPAALDLAHAHVILSEIAPEQVDDPERPRAVNVAVQSAYARLAGMPPAALTAARELYLPVVRTYIAGNPAFTPAQRERLIQRVEAGLRFER